MSNHYFMKNDQPPRQYTREELSVKIDRSVATINQWLHHGRLPHNRLGPKVLFTDEHIEEIKKIMGEKKTWNGK